MADDKPGILKRGYGLTLKILGLMGAGLFIHYGRVLYLTHQADPDANVLLDGTIEWYRGTVEAISPALQGYGTVLGQIFNDHAFPFFADTVLPGLGTGLGIIFQAAVSEGALPNFNLSPAYVPSAPII